MSECITLSRRLRSAASPSSHRPRPAGHAANSLHLSLSLPGAKHVIYGEIKERLSRDGTTLSPRIFIAGATRAPSRHQPLSQPSFRCCYVPSACTSSVIFCVFASSFLPLAAPLCFSFLLWASFVVKVAFLWHLSQAFVSSVSSLTDYLVCGFFFFPLSLIRRAFISKNIKRPAGRDASWVTTPQGKCEQPQHRQHYRTQAAVLKKKKRRQWISTSLSHNREGASIAAEQLKAAYTCLLSSLNSGGSKSRLYIFIIIKRSVDLVLYCPIGWKTLSMTGTRWLLRRCDTARG